MKILNLTPHTIRVVSGDTTLEYPPSGNCARVSSIQKTQFILDGVQVVKTELGDPVGLPKEVPGTVLIVSSMVAMSAPYRGDLISPNSHPNSVIRDESGNVVGVKSFQTFFEG